MGGLSRILYRFRGYVLGVLALALLAVPASPLALESVPASVLAGVLFLAGILLRIKARQYIGDHTRGQKREADFLVTGGPYAYTRHPLYLSNSLVALAAVFFHIGFSVWAVPFAVAVLLFEIFLARAEDSFLKAKFGDAWRHWAGQTPFIPWNIVAVCRQCRRGRCGDAAVPPENSFFRAFCADRSTWAWLLFYNLVLVLIKFVPI